MKGLRCLIAVWSAIGVAACGGSAHRAGSRPRSRPAPHVIPSSTLALVLPASAAGPTTCTVYEAAYATQVVFDSRSLNVSGECQAWTSRQPGAGYLWAYQPTGASIAATTVRACGLEDPSGRVRATVLEDNAWNPLTSLERTAMANACRSLSAAGWARSGQIAR